MTWRVGCSRVGFQEENSNQLGEERAGIGRFVPPEELGGTIGGDVVLCNTVRCFRMD